jgi:inner membrane protein
VGTAVLGRKTGVRAAAIGAVLGTLPDLDVLIPYGDPVKDFTFHRAESHALFWLTLVAPFIAAGIHRWQKGVASFKEWWLLVWLVFITHPLLDAFTVYGTQLLLPFSDFPVGVGSVFIIDPLYTVPLLLGLTAFFHLRRRNIEKALQFNTAGLVASTAYLLWSVAAQAHVEGVVHRATAGTPLAAAKVLVTPAPLNTLLWRVVVMDEEGYHEGYYSLFDQREILAFTLHPSRTELIAPLKDDWAVRRLAWFSKGFYRVDEGSVDLKVSPESVSSTRQFLKMAATARASEMLVSTPGAPVIMTDLRMGQTPWFVFSFVVGKNTDGQVLAVEPSLQIPVQRPPKEALSWIWTRIFDEASPVPTPLEEKGPQG